MAKHPSLGFGYFIVVWVLVQLLNIISDRTPVPDEAILRYKVSSSCYSSSFYPYHAFAPIAVSHATAWCVESSSHFEDERRAGRRK